MLLPARETANMSSVVAGLVCWFQPKRKSKARVAQATPQPELAPPTTATPKLKRPQEQASSA